MRRGNGRAAPALLAGLVGVLIGAGMVWLLVSAQQGSAPAPVGGLAPTSAPVRAVSTTSGDAIVAAVAKVGPAVVNISTEYGVAGGSPLERMMREFMGMPRDPFPRKGQGSGIIIDGKQGHVLTNAHVVRGATGVRVVLPDQRTFEARVVGADPLSDVAVVKIKGGDLPSATLGTAGDLEIGSWVIAIGNPFGFQNSVTVGVLSGKEREIRDPQSGIGLQELLQTDASINRGNSGGALVDLSGRVVGIPTAMIPQAQGMGFAVSVDLAKQVAEKLIRTGKMPWVGVVHHYLLAEEAEKLGLPRGKRRGALLVEVVPGGPADQAGLKPGEVILQFAGKAIDEEKALGSAVRAHDAGDRVEAVVWRDGREVKVQVALGAVPPQIR